MSKPNQKKQKLETPRNRVLASIFTKNPKNKSFLDKTYN